MKKSIENKILDTHSEEEEIKLFFETYKDKDISAISKEDLELLKKRQYELDDLFPIEETVEHQQLNVLRNILLAKTDNQHSQNIFRSESNEDIFIADLLKERKDNLIESTFDKYRLVATHRNIETTPTCNQLGQKVYLNFNSALTYRGALLVNDSIIKTIFMYGVDKVFGQPLDLERFEDNMFEYEMENTFELEKAEKEFKQAEGILFDYNYVYVFKQHDETPTVKEKIMRL